MYYTADDFIRTAMPEPIHIVVKKKLNLLCDFCILKKHTPDYNTMKTLLNQCNTEIAIDNLVHGLLVGTETLDQLFARKEMYVQ